MIELGVKVSELVELQKRVEEIERRLANQDNKGALVSLKSRIGKLERATADLPVPGQIDLVVCLKVAGDPEGRAEGLYPNVDGAVVEYVFGGPEPDRAVLARLKARMPAWGKVIVSYHPDDGTAAPGPARPDPQTLRLLPEPNLPPPEDVLAALPERFRGGVVRALRDMTAAACGDPPSPPGPRHRPARRSEPAVRWEGVLRLTARVNRLEKRIDAGRAGAVRTALVRGVATTDGPAAGPGLPPDVRRDLERGRVKLVAGYDPADLV